MGIGLSLGLGAIVLALMNGSHFKWESGESGTLFSLQIGTVDFGSFAGNVKTLLGIVAVVAFVLGGAFLSINRTKTLDAGSSPMTSNGHFSFIEFVQELKRSKKDCQVGGVCGGLGESSPIPAWVWRMLFLIFAFCFGVGILPYIVMWMCIPEKEEVRASKSPMTTS
ncbi:MAG: PspC domain-containing protein [Verrucomicrobiota bacterium]